MTARGIDYQGGGSWLAARTLLAIVVAGLRRTKIENVDLMSKFLNRYAETYLSSPEKINPALFY